MAYAATKEYAHALIERMEADQLLVVVDLLVRIVDPQTFALAHAPFEDEEISEEENRRAAAARAEGYMGLPTSHEELLSELGITLEEFERMGRESLADEIPAAHG